MADAASMNPAEHAAQEALATMYRCLDQRQSFLFEAGAGAGKTESLVRALRYLIDKQGSELLRQHQRIACITYTNVASDEITSRTDGHPVIVSATIHSFCWSLIKDFQPFLRKKIPELTNWKQKLTEAGVADVGARKIEYDLGYRSIKEDQVFIGHNDVLSLTVELMAQAKFRAVFTSRYPILLIDEYQDTNKELAHALLTYFIDAREGPLIGFFGDHWQKIYGDGCGKIEQSSLKFIGMKANFRSAPPIVDVLNKMRPELPQNVKDNKAEGAVTVYHTNDWTGTRLSGGHWLGDLPPKDAHDYLEKLKAQLVAEGWNFSPEETKILMLTHNILANEQGYNSLFEIFSDRRDALFKKEDPHISFLADTLEPACMAYENKLYGEMFAALGGHTPAIRSHADKTEWTDSMEKLLELRASSTIGAVIDHLRRSKKPHLPDGVEQKEQALEQYIEGKDSDKSIERVRDLKKVSYQEILALDRFIDEKTPFSTKHGVKGAEFENVLVVFGRGWNQYDFNKFLERADAPEKIPSDKRDAYERNRNLFYVTCSRPKKRLALLFTQKLSYQALGTLASWFGKGAIKSVVSA